MKKAPQILLTALLLTTQFVFARNEISFEQELNLSVSDSSTIIVDVGAGSLKLHGDDIDEIRVVAKIYSDDYSNLEKLRSSFEDKMQLTLGNRNSSTVILKALTKKKMFGWSNSNITIDLDVTIPKGLKVEIDDGSGSMTISDINNSLKIDDGSGSITIKNIVGNVLIDDGSGSININNLQGKFHLEDDGSGSIRVNGKKWNKE